jgi:hypothetical protein
MRPTSNFQSYYLTLSKILVGTADLYELNVALRYSNITKFIHNANFLFKN